MMKKVTGKNKTTAKKASVNKAPVTKTTSTPAEAEEAFVAAQLNLVRTYQRETDLATKLVEGLKKKLDQSVTKQRTLKERRVTAFNSYRAKPTPVMQERLETLKAKYAEAAEATQAIQEALQVERARLKTAKTALARIVARDKVLATFEKDYDKAEAKKQRGRKSGGKQRRGRKPTSEAVQRVAEAAPEPVEGVEGTAPEDATRCRTRDGRG